MDIYGFELVIFKVEDLACYYPAAIPGCYLIDLLFLFYRYAHHFAILRIIFKRGACQYRHREQRYEADNQLILPVPVKLVHDAY
jgi:hypothetical protein